MSLSETLFEKLLIEIKKNINNNIYIYINNISEKYNIDKLELQKLWDNNILENIPKSNLETVDLEDLSRARLLKCTRVELSALCKSRGLRLAGKKDDLIDRLLENKNNTNVQENVKVSEPVKNKKEKTNPEILKKLASDIPVFLIKQNNFGNFEHPDTKLVFNKKTETVLGKQEDDGSVSELTDDDIENCKKYKFFYQLPKNLDKNNLDNVNIQELEEDDEDDVIFEEEDEKEKILIDEDEEEEIKIENSDDDEEDEEEDEELEEDE